MSAVVLIGPPVAHGQVAGGGPPPSPGVPASRVHLRSDDARAGLYRHAGLSDVAGIVPGAGAFVGTVTTNAFVCAAPCGLVLPAHERYSIRGAGVTPSAELLLPAGREVTVDVDAGSYPRLWGGVFSTFLGVPMLVGGGVAAGVGLRAPSSPSDDPRALVAPGLVFAGIGAALTAAGIWMWRGGYTEVRVTPGAALAGAAAELR